MPAERRAEVLWQGELMTGHGEVTTASSRTILAAPVSWAGRIASPDGRTSPEELIAAAHASCFAMSLAGTLTRAGFSPQRLEIGAVVTFGHRGEHWAITSSKLDAYGEVPGIDETTYERLVHDAMAACPVTLALQGNVEVSVTPELSADELAASAGP